jgi:hypothetical protein
MIRGIILLFLTLMVVQSQVMPVDAASMTLTNINYTPPLPIVTGNQQHVIAKYYLGPSGSTTFIPSHQLQMQTELLNARWNIQVLLNGLNAAQQSASGSTAFVNGALLSYSLNNDVSLEVTIDGFVPRMQEGQIIIFQIKEIGNFGSVVPGSEITVSQPVAGEPVTTLQSMYPTPSAPLVHPSPTKSVGFPLTLGIGAIILVSILMCRRNR